ncbi:hypothetical protein AGMMS50276_23420 [Synergistales bacterium]|nr:hypothetical protein AGMMS50276_23420 [Synergistales bacterium]
MKIHFVNITRVRYQNLSISISIKISGYQKSVLTVREAGRNLIGPYDSLENMFKDFGIDINP